MEYTQYQKLHHIRRNLHTRFRNKIGLQEKYKKTTLTQVYYVT